MTLLVTGAFGFVGSAILRHLAAAHPDREVVGTDLSLPEIGPLPPNVRAHALDVTDRDAVRRLVDEVRPAGIVHAAALTLVDEADRRRVLDVNLGGGVNVLHAAAESGVHRVVVASSSGVYRDGPGDVRRETDPVDASLAYAASKLALEAVAACYGAIAARIGPVYGPDEISRPTRPRISAIGALAAALQEERAIRVAGAEVTRDWTHADDIAAGVAALLEAPRLSHQIYNLACGTAVPFRAVVEAFRAHGLDARWEEPAEIGLAARDRRPALSIERLQAETGFAPRHDIATGIAALIAAQKPRHPSR